METSKKPASPSGWYCYYHCVWIIMLHELWLSHLNTDRAIICYAYNTHYTRTQEGGNYSIYGCTVAARTFEMFLILHVLLISICAPLKLCFVFVRCLSFGVLASITYRSSIWIRPAAFTHEVLNLDGFLADLTFGLDFAIICTFTMCKSFQCLKCLFRKIRKL